MRRILSVTVLLCICLVVSGCTGTDYHTSEVSVCTWDSTDGYKSFSLDGISAKVLEETGYREAPGCVDEVIFAVPNGTEFLEAVQKQTSYSHKEISVKNKDVYVFRDGNSCYYLYNSNDSKRWGNETVFTLVNSCSWIAGGGETVYYFPLVDFGSRYNGRVDIGAGTVISMDWEALKAYYMAMDGGFYEIDDAQHMIYLKTAVLDETTGKLVMTNDYTVRLEHKTINEEHNIYVKTFTEKN